MRIAGKSSKGGQVKGKLLSHAHIWGAGSVGGLSVYSVVRLLVEAAWFGGFLKTLLMEPGNGEVGAPAGVLPDPYVKCIE